MNVPYSRPPLRVGVGSTPEGHWGTMRVLGNGECARDDESRMADPCWTGTQTTNAGFRTRHHTMKPSIVVSFSRSRKRNVKNECQKKSNSKPLAREKMVRLESTLCPCCLADCTTGRPGPSCAFRGLNTNIRSDQVCLEHGPAPFLLTTPAPSAC